MRVLFVSKPVVPPFHDGATCLVRDVATHLTRAEASVLVTRDAPGLGDRVSLERIYPRAGSFAPKLADNALVLARLIAGRGHDLWHFVFAPNPRSSQAARLAKALRRTPTVQTVASTPKSFEGVSSLLFGEQVVCLSMHTLERFVHAGVPRERLALVPPPLPPMAKISDEARARAIEAAGLSGRGPLVVYPGDLEVSSGARVMADAAPAIVKAGGCVVFACRAKTPRAREVALSLASELAPLGEGVAFVGEVPDLPALLASSRVVAFPVDDLYGKVDVPMVLLEAASLRIPVVAASGGPLEGLEGATLVPPQSPEALAAALGPLLDDDRAREEAGARLESVYRARFSPEVVAAAYDALYAELCAK